MNFVKVTDESFDGVYEKMVSAFPYCERRDKEDQKKCFSDSHFNFFEIYDGGEAVGFISPWVFDDFVFIEHLAIDETKRGGGYGTKTMELVKEIYKKPVILEAEPPETEQSIKRIKFYEKLGFKVNDREYYQPSFHGTDEKVPLKVLSFPEKLSDKDFETFFTVTRKFVYKTKI